MTGSFMLSLAGDIPPIFLASDCLWPTIAGTEISAGPSLWGHPVVLVQIGRGYKAEKSG